MHPRATSLAFLLIISPLLSYLYVKTHRGLIIVAFFGGVLHSINTLLSNIFLNSFSTAKVYSFSSSLFLMSLIFLGSTNFIDEVNADKLIILSNLKSVFFFLFNYISSFSFSSFSSSNLLLCLYLAKFFLSNTSLLIF